MISSLCAFHFGVESKLDNNYFEYFCAVIIFSSIISFCIQVLQIFEWDGFYFPWVSAYPGDGRAFGNLGQPNQLASLVTTAFLCCIYLNNKKEIRTSLSIFLALIFGFSLSLAGSKTAIVSLIFAFFYLFNFKNKIISCLFFFCASSYFLSHFLLSGITRDYSRVDISTGRFSIWEMMLGAIKTNPFLGYGMGNASIANFEVVENFPKQWNLFTAHSHNLFLDFLLWFGVPLGLFVSIQLAFILYKHFFKKMDERNKIVACIAMPLAIHSMLEFPLHYAYFLIPFGYLIGVSWEEKKITKKFYLFPIFTVLIAVFGIGIFVEYMKLEKSYMEQRFFLHNFKKSQNQETISPRYLDIITSNFNFMTKEKIDESDLKEIENLVKVYPSYRNLYLLCTYFENKDTEKFKFYYEKAINILKSDEAESFKKYFNK